MRLQVGQVALAQFQNRSLDTAAQLIVTPDTDGFLSQISTVQKVSENQNSILQDYQQAQANLAALEHSSETDLATLAEKEKQLKSLKDASDKKIAEARKVLNKLSATQRQRLSDEQKRAAARANAAGAAASRDAARGPISGSSKGVRALAFAKAQLGEPYVRNADGPSSWDCSGLTMRAWGSVGVSLPHSSGQQYNRGRPVARSDLQLGDLVFFYSGISHVGHLRRRRPRHPRATSRQVGGVHQDVLHAVRRSPSARLIGEAAVAGRGDFPALHAEHAYAAFCVSHPQPRNSCDGWLRWQ